MSACSELMCSQLLVPLAGLTSRGQAGLSCSLGKGGQGKLCVPALQCQGCRRGRWCKFSACPSSCCLVFSSTSCWWNQLGFYQEAERRNRTLTKKVLFFFSPLMLSCLCVCSSCGIYYISSSHRLEGVLPEMHITEYWEWLDKLEGGMCVWKATK